MKRSGDLEYACARVAARFGERPAEGAWRTIAIVRGFAAFLDAAGTPPFRRWLSGITADAGPHDIEAALRARWRALVDELCGWMPEQWHAAIAWAGALTELPCVQHLARGAEAPSWMADDPVFAEVSRNALQAVRRGALAPLAAAWTSPDGFMRAWVDEWWRRAPPNRRTDSGPLADCARLLIAHRAAAADASVSDGTLMRRTLAARLCVLYHRATLDPAALFIFLALSALDMERLRGELLRRALFPRLGRVG
ncbi:MAG TPA: hypothetical protein VLI21_09595 [Casimicrobiaceae bacterium]|nr:hypothetical protein [Casimicrobiaceae bacterium]